MVERGPEKAGVGGSIPSLATTPFHFIASRAPAERSSVVKSAALKRPSRRRFNPVSGHHIINNLQNRHSAFRSQFIPIGTEGFASNGGVD